MICAMRASAPIPRLVSMRQSEMNATVYFHRLTGDADPNIQVENQKIMLTLVTALE